MHLPDYHGGSIVNLMASLQSGLDGPAHAYVPLRSLPPAQVRRHRQILLLVVDGLGLNYLRAHREAACLNEHLRGAMTSVYPPTTAAAITTFLTGVAPQQHGLTGWHMYFRELGSVLSVLPGRARYGGVGLSDAGIDVPALLGHTPFSESIGVDAYTLSPAYIAHSDFNLAHLGKSQLLSYRNLDEMFAQLLATLRSATRKFVYAYWPELDTLGHRAGMGSAVARQHLLVLDRAFEMLLKQLEGTDTLVVLCADHGQVDTTPPDRIQLDDHPELENTLVLPLCGESRSVYCYLRPGCERAFDDYIDQHFAAKARAYASPDLLGSHWFGLGEPHPRLHQRIGDRVLLMQEHYVLKDWLVQERYHDLVGVHGGLSEDELYVPLIVAEV